MDKASALGLLGLEGNPDVADIKSALAKKREDIASKKASAPTAALRSKFEALEQKLDEAERALLAGVAGTAPSASRPASLSQTKLADLPQGQQSYTGFDGEAAGAQIHLQPGQVLANRYEIKEQIGAGGMGAVFRAHDRNTGRDIALKVLLPSLMQNERARERFLDEARISQQLSHPNIVNVFDVQQDGDFYFLTMELLEGQGLRDWLDNLKLSRQPVPLDEARRIAAELCDALAYAHDFTVHRDIKPENIWLDGRGRVKLMDFGIARLQSTSQRTKTGAAMGTAYYMAPEQLQGRSDIDGRADLYALGVLLYEMLTDQVPAGRIESAISLRREIGKPLSLLIDQLLSANPDQRPASAAAVKARIEGTGGGAGFSLPELPWKGIGMAAALLLAVIGVGAVVSGGGINLGGLLPMSAEQKAQREGQLAKLQGEIKVLKQRLETSRRDLASDVKEAERNKSKNLKALQHWQTLTENSIFNGSLIGELEGTLSMAEALLRKEQYDSAEAAFMEVKVGYDKLNTGFPAGREIYAADQIAQKAKSDWLAYAKKYSFNGVSPSANQAQQKYDESVDLLRGAELASALLSLKQAAEKWQAARQDRDVLAQVKAIEPVLERKRIASINEQIKKSLNASMRDIPAGSLQLYDRDANYNRTPILQVTIKAFRMMEHEVTFAQWDACVAAGGCSHRPDDSGWGRNSRPVMSVGWDVVTQQFIPWLNKATGQRFRLPSEAEWEYAARAGSTTSFSWGDNASCSNARYGRSSNGPCAYVYDGTVPVKSFAPNRFGLYDMHGNVSEWVQDCWNKSYQGASSNGSARQSGDCGRRVHRGGHWMYDAHAMELHSRYSYYAGSIDTTIGFRLVQDR